jgi:CrcB protein
MDKYLLIGLGAMVGANARYLLGTWAAERWGGTFPIGTLLVNLSGSLLLGFLLTVTAERVLLDPRYRLLLVAGFLGGYTTFSTYTYESVALITAGSWGLGLLNLLGSSLAGALAAGLGMVLGRAL